MNHNDSGSAAQLPPNLALQSIEAHPLEFTGSGGEYFRVWIVNVLLGILTLGFYTPWARRRTDRRGKSRRPSGTRHRPSGTRR